MLDVSLTSKYASVFNHNLFAYFAKLLKKNVKEILNLPTLPGKFLEILQNAIRSIFYF